MRRMNLVIVVLIVALIVGSVPVGAQGSYEQVDILVEWAGEAETDDFETLVFGAFQRYNILATITRAADLETTLRRRIESGNPPDLVITSRPALLDDFADEGVFVNLGALLGSPSNSYANELDTHLTRDGVIYGRFVRLTVKSLIWHDPDVITPAQLWPDLLA